MPRLLGLLTLVVVMVAVHAKSPVEMAPMDDVASAAEQAMAELNPQPKPEADVTAMRMEPEQYEDADLAAMYSLGTHENLFLGDDEDDTPSCIVSDSLVITEACQCGHDANNVCAKGKYCHTDNTCNAHAKAVSECAYSDGKVITSNCKCADAATTNECGVGSFCWADKTCNAQAKGGAAANCSNSTKSNSTGNSTSASSTTTTASASVTACTLSDTSAVTAACKCSDSATSNECASGKFCHTDKTCNAAAKATGGAAVTACTISDSIAITNNPCKCATTSTTNDCAVGKFCHNDNTCQDAAKVDDTTDATSTNPAPNPSPPPPGVTDCTPDDGLVVVTECKCAEASTTNECAKGKYCWTDNACNAGAKTAVASTSPCTSSDTTAITSKCKCSDAATTDECASGRYCWADKTCNADAKPVDCSTSDSLILTKDCKCATSATSEECKVGKYCHADKTCADGPKDAAASTTACTVFDTNPITGAACKCGESATTDECAVGKFCHSQDKACAEDASGDEDYELIQLDESS